jgi:hypothetical protein
VVLNIHELKEFQVLRQQFKQYVADLAKQKAQARGRSIAASDHFNLKESFNGASGR